MSSPGLYGGQIRDFLRSQCAGGDLKITSAEGEVTPLHSFFLLGNLPQLSLLLDRCHQCWDLATEDITIIAPGILQNKLQGEVIFCNIYPQTILHIWVEFNAFLFQTPGNKK